MILKPNWLEPEIDQNVILKFSLIVCLVYNKDTDIEAPVPASVSHHCLVLFQRIHINGLRFVLMSRLHEQCT